MASTVEVRRGRVNHAGAWVVDVTADAGAVIDVEACWTVLARGGILRLVAETGWIVEVSACRIRSHYDWGVQ
jgi:hypothetical protein